MTDVALQQTRAAGSGLFTVAALQKAVAFVVLIALVVFFSFANENFAEWSNLVNIMQATAVNGVLGVAVTFVIVSGGIDLSVGTLMTFTSVMTGVVLTFWHFPMWAGIIAALLVGMCCGATSGLIIAKLKLPPFIATLGMMLILKGGALVVSGIAPIYFNDTPNFSLISPDSSITPLIAKLGALLHSDRLNDVEIPNGVFVLFGVALIASIILSKSILGRYVFA